MMEKTIIKNGQITRLLKKGGPGAFTPQSVERAREIIEDIILKIGSDARKFAEMAGKKRVTEQEIKVAFEYQIKK